MKSKYFSLFVLSVLSAVTVWSFCAVAQNQSATGDDNISDSSVTLEDNPFSGDEAPPSTIQHRTTGPAQGPTENFTVKTWRISSTRKGTTPIELLLPAHNSKFTPGVVRFSWKANSKSRRSIYDFVLEKVDVAKKAVQPTTLEKLSIDLKSGNYRWQVVNERTHLASRWRSFKVIDMKSQSLTQLYQGRTPGEQAARLNSHPLANHHAIEPSPRQKYPAKTVAHTHVKELTHGTRSRAAEISARAEALRTARHSVAGQPRPSSVAPNGQGIPRTQSTQFQDTDEQALAEDTGIPSETTRQPSRPLPTRAAPKTVQNRPTKRENIKQARKAPPPRPHKTPAETRVPAETAPRAVAPPPRRHEVAPPPAPAAPAQQPAKSDERQRELDTLKFDE